MALLSSPRLDAVRLIREQLRCTLCRKIFQEPQCLDCKHNFCLSCILHHLKQNEAHCPTCRLPTRPSEVTRNQFLESILVAWNGVETELKALNGDPSLHATPLSVADTDKALHRVANGVATSSDQERHTSRGPVANHKWHIDTHEIRQELHSAQPYLPQQFASRHENTKYWKKTSSSDLPETYGASATRIHREWKHTQNESQREIDPIDGENTSERDEDSQEEAKDESNAPSSNNLLATQDLEKYLTRITKQREALSQWERGQHNQSNKTSLLLDLERSLQSSDSFDELLRERQMAQQHEENGDLLTQMTQMTQMTQLTQMTQMTHATSALESPDLLATFREHKHRNEKDWLVATRRGFVASPSRKRLWMPTLQDSRYPVEECKTKARRESRKKELKDVANRQPDTMLSVEDDEASDDNVDDDGDEDYEEEYEMKPAKPLLSVPETRSSLELHSENQTNSIPRETGHSNKDVRNVIPVIQSKESPQSERFTSQAPKLLTSGTKFETEKTTKVPSGTPRPWSAKAVKPLNHTQLQPENSLDPGKFARAFVFVSSDLTREEVKRVLEATQRLGGKFGHDFDLKRDPVTTRFCTSVTHLITKAVPPMTGAKPHELRCKRTAKYMRALAEGTFVMDFSWVSASLAAGRWLTEDPFEMSGDIYSEAVGKPHEGHLRRVQTGRRNSIFSLFCFVLLVSESDFDFQFASVKALVNNFGGTVVQADKAPLVPSKSHSRRTLVGVVAKTTLPAVAKAKWQRFQIPIVRITWIFDSVSHLEVLPFDDYYPY